MMSAYGTGQAARHEENGASLRERNAIVTRGQPSWGRSAIFNDSYDDFWQQGQAPPLAAWGWIATKWRTPRPKKREANVGVRALIAEQTPAEGRDRRRLARPGAENRLVVFARLPRDG